MQLNPLERLPEEWEALMGEWGQPRYRGLQVFRWIHQRGVLDVEGMTDLPKALRTRLLEAGVSPALEVVQDQRSHDGTRKLLLNLRDGRRIESVLIPREASEMAGVAHHDEDGAEDDADDEADAATVGGGSVTQCVSSQVGCAMACAFCASGIAGLKRNLNAAEIVAQVLVARSQLDVNQRLSGLVYMGMGEPLHNYEVVVRSLRLLTHPEGVGMSPRRITISTSGLVPQIDRLAEDFGGRIQLAVSLHAVDDTTRSLIMPINRKHGLDSLMAALRRYPVTRRQRLTIEYTLIRDVNDAPAHARQLVDLLRDLRVRVNLIPMNPVTGSTLGAPEPAVVERFQQQLRDRGLLALVRQRRGDDIDAACGQLALQGERRRVRMMIG